MKIAFLCGHCRTELGVPESAAGKAARCPTCQAVVEVPAAPSRPKAVPILPSAAEPAPDDDAVDAEPVRPRYDPRVAARYGVAKTEPARVEKPASRDAAPRRRAKTFAFDCLSCGRLMNATTAGVAAECPRCGEEHSYREVKEEGAKRRESQKWMRRNGETPETLRRRRTLWYILAGLGGVGLLAVALAQLAPSARGFAFAVVVALVLAQVVLAFVCMGADSDRGESLGMGHIVLFFLFFGLLFILIYSLVRVSRYPQLSLAFLVNVVAFLGVFSAGGSGPGRGADTPAEGPRLDRPQLPDIREPFQPPFQAPRLPKYTPPNPPVAATDVPGAVAYWRFDEGDGATAEDSVGGLLGTLHGAKWVRGIRGQALEFDGRADWFDFGPTEALDFPADGAFTVSCWVKPASRIGPVFTLRGEERLGTATIFGVWLENGTLCSWVRKDGSLLFPNEQFSPDPLVPNEWHHVALVRHADGTVDLYQDGVLASRRQSVKSRGGVTTKFRALGWERHPRLRPGKGDDLRAKYFQGAIDEFAVFHRALTAAELARR